MGYAEIMHAVELVRAMNIKEKLKDIRTYIELYLAYSKITKPIITKAKEVLFSKKPPFALEIEESENFIKLCEVHEKIIKLLKETPELKEEPVVADFLGKSMPNLLNLKNKSEFDFDIMQQNGKFIIISSKDADKIIQKINDEKEKEISEKVNVLPISEAKRFHEYKNEDKVVTKGVAAVADKLNIQHKSLVSLSAWVEKLYVEKRIDEVEETKSDMYKRYDLYGIKFCNLYAKGYLKSLLSKLHERYQKDASINIDEEICQFVSKKAKAIYFIHPYMDENDVVRIVKQIDEHLRDKVEYIAIHSLGANVKKAKEIAENISIPSNSDYINKVIEPKKTCEFSKIWYREDGINIYSLITGSERES